VLSVTGLLPGLRPRLAQSAPADWPPGHGQVSRQAWGARPCPRHYAGDQRSDHCPPAA